MRTAAEPRLSIEMLVLQSTPFCNLDCSYCYLPDRASKRQMSQATLERTFERVFTSTFLSGHLTVLWHAGEPLVPGVAYYKNAFGIIDRLKPPGLAISHSIQTNATLLNRQWIDFLRAHDVRVGTSIDGPADLNDRSRKTRAGGGSFEQTMRGIRLLQEHDYPFHVITVLTRESLRQPQRLFDFYVESGIGRVAFNVEEIEGIHATSSLSGAAADREVREFYQTFMALTDAQGAKIEVREFVGAFDAIANPESMNYGNPLAEPLRTLSIGVNGEIGTFAPELLGYASERHGELVFGNIHDHEIADILHNPKFIAVSDEVARGQQRCRASCQYFSICLGGSPANKLFENGSFDSTETLFCRLSKKAVIDVVLGKMEKAFNLAS
ncbi:MAG TPA: cyclophane-forming radical SAM/SPASM peptide maturase GrrM/OscB [Bradyrhizobium sp.]|nr:cyclophane-forming radical SAM/SPASM peptide maturase GrrM/OscB [Bradyrhizobium sp.]